MVDFKTIGLNEPFYITVKNWEKYQGKNIGRRFWIKLDVMLFDDCLVASLTPVTFKCYIGALLLAGKCGTSEVRVTIKSWSSEVQVRASDLRVSASSLQENQLVTAQTARQEKNREEQRRTEKKRTEQKKNKQKKMRLVSRRVRTGFLNFGMITVVICQRSNSPFHQREAKR